MRAWRRALPASHEVCTGDRRQGSGLILFKGCDAFSPEPLGRQGALLAGLRIVDLADEIREPALHIHRRRGV